MFLGEITVSNTPLITEVFTPYRPNINLGIVIQATSRCFDKTIDVGIFECLWGILCGKKKPLTANAVLKSVQYNQSIDQSINQSVEMEEDNFDRCVEELMHSFILLLTVSLRKSRKTVVVRPKTVETSGVPTQYRSKHTNWRTAV